ncbi:NHS-like protein 1 [Seriola lalandi dorsalis]|uniref:NHS-like protein 1 n=1 Tax=Seriola lalandi dorsalis TaxID=1841481 RepID=UPI000C6F59D6|nr:NHS-like protein 1 [Seriola lalandi dorsalis]XP_056222127.1 NHS-like protein 1 [Seriola aureovittata]
MSKGTAAVNGAALVNGGYAHVNHVSHRSQNGDCKGRPRSGQVRPLSQVPGERSLLTVPASGVTPGSHQRRWSADFSKCSTAVIAVRKNKKEPRPPQRRASLLSLHSATDASSKRYSCPHIGVFSSPSQSSSSSSSSSISSSCSSPPPVQTSFITGRDPLGWKVQPKSSFTSPRDRTKRLSLQIPLPVVFPDPKLSPAPTSQPDSPPDEDPSSRTKPLLRPKPTRRHHSDSSAFVKSLPAPLPAVTLDDLCAVHLRPVAHSNESDDVFSEADEEEVKATAQPRKTPPPVPRKSSMARQIAQLIALSWQRYTPKPKRPNQTVNGGGLHPAKTDLRVGAELRLDAGCERQSATPRFPGREI